MRIWRNIQIDREGYKETTGKLKNPRWQIILFYFYFYLLCNSLKYMRHYDSKEVCEII